MAARPAPVPAEAGVTRKMLESYDRAIVTEPEFFPDKRDSLIGEFENYLKILKAVSAPAALRVQLARRVGGAVGCSCRCLRLGRRGRA